ncbi:MAG: cupin domain-containing protein [Candidatus Micrarchaeota archaeon]
MVRKEDRVEHKNSEKCMAFEYPMGDKDINIAEILINGRYPDTGSVVNEEVKEIVFVTGGEGKIVVEGKEYELKKCDSILLLPKQKYFFEGDSLQIITACSPAWRPEQHKNI